MKMKRKIVYGIMLMAFLTGILTLPTNIQQAKASDGFGYIYIKADGSIDPPDAPISKDAENVTYSLTADIANKSIIIERDNIVLDGNNCKMSGPEEYGRFGVNMTNRSKVTIQNMRIEKFYIGIYVLYSTKIVITGNNASNNKVSYVMEYPDFEIIWEGVGIFVYGSNETLIFNNTLSNNLYGMDIGKCNSTRIDSNNVYDNKQYEPPTWFGWGIYIHESKNVTTINNMISNNSVYGIYDVSSFSEYGSDNVFRNNTINGHTYGLLVRGYDSVSHNYTIEENVIFSNTYGINFDSSTSNTITNNRLFKNAYGITLENTNNSKILYNTVLNNSALGIYIRSKSYNGLVINNSVLNNSRGIRFEQSSNNIIFGNIISSNVNDGLIIYYYSSNNEVVGNNITLNDKGITLTYDCYNNKIFHNNFIGNIQHVFTDMNSTWDNGYPPGGNYWDNYTGVDFKWGITQNETGSDGIGDTAYSINENNTDCYPLMGPINIFEAGVWDTTIQYVDVISNSTVSNFQINITEKTISFNVTGYSGAGFCRVIIPKIIVDTLWLGNYAVLVNGVPVEFRNWTDLENVYLYIEYSHSEKEVTIISEFSFTAIASILMMTTTLTLILRKMRRNRS